MLLLNVYLKYISLFPSGFGVQGYPSLWPLLDAQRVLIESCPISNQLLGLVVDQRNHPVGALLHHALPRRSGPDREGVASHYSMPPVWQELLVNDPSLSPLAEALRFTPSLGVSVSNDDPGFWGIDGVVSYDWYAAVLGWDLSLAGVKQLCVDSIVHSGASIGAKARMLAQWSKQWDAWIQGLQ